MKHHLPQTVLKGEVEITIIVISTSPLKIIFARRL